VFSLSTPSVSLPSLAVSKPVLRAFVSPSSSQPTIADTSEKTYVAGRRYTITKEDGVTVQGIWDGKYLTVLTTTAPANTAASQTPGELAGSAYGKPVAELRSVTCHAGSHSVTCHLNAGNDLYLNPSQMDWYSIYLPWRDGRLS